MDVAALFIKSVLLVFSSISLLLYILLLLVNKLVAVGRIHKAFGQVPFNERVCLYTCFVCGVKLAITG